MKVDKTQTIKAVDGKTDMTSVTIIQGTDPKTGAQTQKVNEKVMVLEDIMINALMNQELITPDMDGKDKIARADLAERIFRTEELVEFKAEEVALIKDLVNQTNKNPMVVKRAWELLDPDTKEEDDESEKN